MPLYESVFIARQDISAGSVDNLTDEFEKIIADNGGSVARREYWGLRNLAFRMKKNRKGHYVMFNIDAPSGAVHEMERNMRLHEDVLRYLTIRLEELREDPSPMVHGKTDRDRADRRGRDDDDKPSESKAEEKVEEKTDAEKPAEAAATEEKAPEKAEEAKAAEATASDDSDEEETKA